MRRTYIPLLLVLILFLTACRPAAPTAAPPAAPPKETEAIRVEVTTIQPPTLAPTPVRPTSTPPPTPTDTPPGLALLKIDPNLAGASLGQSPDGKWLWSVDSTATPAEKGNFSYHVTRFARADGSAFWELQPEAKQLGPDPQGEIAYYPVFWMPRDPFVYLAVQKCCVDGPGVHFVTGYNLVRLNLQTGAVATQVPGLKMHDFAFSPNGKFLADIPRSSQELRLSRLPDGGTKQIPLTQEFSQNGSTVFSPDERRAVVLSCVLAKADSDECQRYDLLLVDTEVGFTTELVRDLQTAMGSPLPAEFTLPRLTWYDSTHIHMDFPASPKIPWSWRIDVKTGHVNRVTQ